MGRRRGLRGTRLAATRVDVWSPVREFAPSTARERDRVRHEQRRVINAMYREREQER